MLKAKNKSIIPKEFITKYSNLLVKCCRKYIQFVNLRIGDTYLSFPTTTLDSDIEFELVHKSGEIWLIDFWATWCAPCQPAMDHNQEMLEHHPEWKGKVRIFGFGIDAIKSERFKELRKRNGMAIKHLYANGGWKAKGVGLYSISGIPFVVLIDIDGKIIKIGNPNECDLESTIGALLKGSYVAKSEMKYELATVSKEFLPSPDDFKKNAIKAIMSKIDMATKYGICLKGVFTCDRLTGNSSSEFFA